METMHPSAVPLPLERERRSGNQCQTKNDYKMVGTGYKSSEEEDEMDQRPRDIYDGSESDTQSDDEDDSDTKSSPDSDNSKYADFQQLYNQNETVAAAKGEEMTVDERRKHFTKARYAVLLQFILL